MTKEEAEAFLAIIMDNYVNQSADDVVNPFMPIEFRSVFDSTSLQAWKIFLSDEENKAWWLELLERVSLPDELSIEEGDEDAFDIFFIVTFMSKIKLAVDNLNQESIGGVFDAACEWMLSHHSCLQNYFKIQKSTLIYLRDKKICSVSEDKKSQFFGFLLSFPLSHQLQFRHILQFTDEYFAKYQKYRDVVGDLSRQFPQSQSELVRKSIFLQSGPSIGEGLDGLSNFIKNIYVNRTQVIFALGEISTQKDVISFPLQNVKKYFIPNDFFNYLGVATNVQDKDYCNEAYKDYRLPSVNVNPDGTCRYSVDETYDVVTKELPGYFDRKDSAAIIGCNLRVHELQITPTAYREDPHIVLVVNLGVADNNPINLTDTQLKFVVDTLIKVIVDGFAKEEDFIKGKGFSAAIHCRSGLGRTGVLAYVAARMFCPNMPAEPEAAVKWLRNVRPGLIITVEQLIDAEQMSQKVLTMLKRYEITGGYNWRQYYDDNKLEKHLPQLTPQTRTKQGRDAELSSGLPLNSKKQRSEKRDDEDSVLVIQDSDSPKIQLRLG